jgi:hypothetical protein
MSNEGLTQILYNSSRKQRRRKHFPVHSLKLLHLMAKSNIVQEEEGKKLQTTITYEFRQKKSLKNYWQIELSNI